MDRRSPIIPAIVRPIFRDYRHSRILLAHELGAISIVTEILFIFLGLLQWDEMEEFSSKSIS